MKFIYNYSELRICSARPRLGSRHQALRLMLPVRNHANSLRAHKPPLGSARATVRGERVCANEE
eukprot:1489160-Pleurochrysis_carterae.AAC.2